MKKKYVFVGDIESVNLEIISKSHNKLKKHVMYIIFGNYIEIKEYLNRIKNNLKINLIKDPINFTDYVNSSLNIFDIDHISKFKYKNLLNQIKITNNLSNSTGIDLITMPINKALFKKKINFVGMTEYLGFINDKETFMILRGEEFSVLPLTTHINPKNIYKEIKYDKIKKKITKVLSLINKKEYKLNIKHIKFLCYNPHCGEENQLGNEDSIILKVISKFNLIDGPFSADSAFLNLRSNSLIISTYHDQVLIPFKTINKKSYNLTIGLNYNRLSPAHGTAKDIIFQNKANLDSYIECMKN